MSDMTNEQAKEVLENPINNEDVLRLFLKMDIETMKCAISSLPKVLFEDGTLTVHVKDGSKVRRVLVIGDNIFGGLYYPDSESDNIEKIRAEIQKEENILYHDCESDFSKRFDVIRVDTVLSIIDKHIGGKDK